MRRSGSGDEKPASHWETVRTGVTQAKVGVDGAEAALALSEGGLSKAKMTLHAKTKQVVGLAKVRFRKDEVKSQVFAGLRAMGSMVTLARRSADDLAAAWAQADATGSYEGLNLAGYNAALRMALDTATTTRENARAGVKQAKKSQQTVLKDAHDDAVAWYSAATRVFDINTQIGAQIRAQIPT